MSIQEVQDDLGRPSSEGTQEFFRIGLLLFPSIFHFLNRIPNAVIQIDHLNKNQKHYAHSITALQTTTRNAHHEQQHIQTGNQK
jgi:hypothetical protein